MKWRPEQWSTCPKSKTTFLTLVWLMLFTHKVWSSNSDIYNVCDGLSCVALPLPAANPLQQIHSVTTKTTCEKNLWKFLPDFWLHSHDKSLSSSPEPCWLQALHPCHQPWLACWNGSSEQHEAQRAPAGARSIHNDLLSTLCSWFYQSFKVQKCLLLVTKVHLSEVDLLSSKHPLSSSFNLSWLGLKRKISNRKLKVQLIRVWLHFNFKIISKFAAWCSNDYQENEKTELEFKLPGQPTFSWLLQWWGSLSNPEECLHPQCWVWGCEDAEQQQLTSIQHSNSFIFSSWFGPLCCIWFLQGDKVIIVYDVT